MAIKAHMRQLPFLLLPGCLGLLLSAHLPLHDLGIIFVLSATLYWAVAGLCSPSLGHALIANSTTHIFKCLHISKAHLTAPSLLPRPSVLCAVHRKLHLMDLWVCYTLTLAMILSLYQAINPRYEAAIENLFQVSFVQPQLNNGSSHMA